MVVKRMKLFALAMTVCLLGAFALAPSAQAGYRWGDPIDPKDKTGLIVGSIGGVITLILIGVCVVKKPQPKWCKPGS